MKKIILFALLLTATSVLAQSTYVENGYHTMLSEGKVWNYTYHSQNGDQKMSIEVEGDTVIEGTKCRKLYLCLPDKRFLYGCYYEENNGISDVSAYMMLDIQKENGQLVMQPLETASPCRLLYSFMSKGATITYGWFDSYHFDMMSRAVIRRSARYDINTVDIPYPIIPSRCELIRVDDDYFARALMTDLQKRDTVETWVSGVGERCWGIMEPIAGVGKDDGGEWVEFESCEENGRCLYTKADFNLEALHQDYRPFVEDNKTWTCYGNPHGAGLYCYRLRGDTLVNNQNCLKLYSQNRYNNGKTLYEGALYEKDKRVYIYEPGASECSLLYDFSLKPGEEVILDQNSRYSHGIRALTDVYELHAGQLIRIMAFYETDRYLNEETHYFRFLGNWIEGVGPGYMLDILDESYFNVYGDGYGRCIIDCSVNGQSIYRANDYDFYMSLSDYYYYRGNKIPLFLNKNKVVVSIPKECGDVIERFHSNVQALAMIKDETFDIYVISRSEYEKLASLSFWAEDAKSVILTSSYFTEDNKEVFSTPYLNVRLKKEEDIDLLTSYAEQYKLRINGNISPLMPLWFILSVTPDSDKSPLKCANELYESGDFAASVPDLADSMAYLQKAYRPFVEEGKVWKVGAVYSGNPVQVVQYYYFDGDTIINEKICKQMMCQRYVSPEHPDYAVNSQDSSLSYVGAWYEEDQKVYFYNARNKQFRLWYDFSVDANDSVQLYGGNYIIGPKQTGGLKGFKGVYRDVMWGRDGANYYNTTWLEGVGSIEGPIDHVYYGKENHSWFLMECFVGDEVIYLNDEYEDGATPGGMNARKRFDFTHTTKEQPKMPMRRDAEQSLYGEYNNLQLGINLEPVDDAYLVRITDEEGKAVYEKAINAGNIVGLNVDISSYSKGCYTVTVENSNEAFTGEFETQTTGIEEVRSQKSEVRGAIYNLQGQRLTTLQKGLNIVNGKKVYVK